MENLSPQEIDLLIEAVEIWETKPICDELNGMIMEIMFAPSREAGREVGERAKEKLRSMEGAGKVRKERGCLLKAKLIKLRQSPAAEQVFGEARGEERETASGK